MSACTVSIAPNRPAGTCRHPYGTRTTALGLKPDYVPLDTYGHLYGLRKTTYAPKSLGRQCLKFVHAQHSATDYTVLVRFQKSFTNEDRTTEVTWDLCGVPRPKDLGSYTSLWPLESQKEITLLRCCGCVHSKGFLRIFKMFWTLKFNVQVL